MTSYLTVTLVTNCHSSYALVMVDHHQPSDMMVQKCHLNMVHYGPSPEWIHYGLPS